MVNLSGVIIENFKSYESKQWIETADLSIFMGANSSGKSTALQTLLAIKQTLECNSPDIDLLLSGKYVTLGDYNDIVNNINKKYIRIGVTLNSKNEIENKMKENSIIWQFENENSLNGGIILSQIEFLINESQVKFERVDRNKYSIFINGEKTQLLTEIYNLEFGDMYIEYDEELNLLFNNFLNDLLVIFTKNKKTPLINKKEIASINGSKEFFGILMNHIDSQNKYDSFEEKPKEIEKTMVKVNSLINEYSKEQFSLYYKYKLIPDFLEESILNLVISNLNSESSYFKKLHTVIEKYKTNLNEYKTKKDFTNSKRSYSILKKNILTVQNDSKNNKEDDSDKIAEAFINYKDFCREVLGKIFYIGPIREKPQGVYNLGFESIPKYVGNTGAYFASVMLHENKERKYLFPNESIEESNLSDALDAWSIHLNIASGINIEQRNSFGFGVSIKNMDNKNSDIMNVGIGTSQVLPILITGLLSEENETLIFEQPELHLHPYSQSRLADFFISLAKNRRKVIVETHSEYMILRLRYHILSENIGENDVIINFFQNKNGTKVRKGILGSYGSLEYPIDFKDETQQLINDLMNAAMMRGKNHEKKNTN